jgi:hypothetical protein
MLVVPTDPLALHPWISIVVFTPNQSAFLSKAVTLYEIGRSFHASNVGAIADTGRNRMGTMG